jgi:hypothetical protein
MGERVFLSFRQPVYARVTAPASETIYAAIEKAVIADGIVSDDSYDIS